MKPNDTVELVFDGIPEEFLDPFIEGLLDKDGIILIENEKGPVPYRRLERGVLSCIEMDSDSGFLLINVKKITVAGIEINMPLLRVLHFENSIELSITFDDKDLLLENISLVKPFFFGVKKMASNYKIANFYCGIEPALDMDTRFFDESGLGPLKI